MMRPIALSVAVAMLAAVAGGVQSHGELDQYLDGQPQCAESNFPVTAGAETNPRQEFVPSGSLISSIAVCAGSTVPIGTTLTLVVREGTLNDPGEVLGEKTVPISLIAAWPSHADFDPLVRVKPDKTHVIEMRAEAGVFWRATQEDKYCAGNSTAAPGDFSFATYDGVRPSEAARTCDNDEGSGRGALIAGVASGAALAALIGVWWFVLRRRRRSATHS